jgi:hypothetical protein
MWYIKQKKTNIIHKLSLYIVLYTVEFQKRGLPHGHIIFWVSTDT